MAEVTLKHIKKVYPNTEKKSKKGQKKSNLMVTEEGVLAVQDFNLDIKDREFIVLVGPSGCGKSTTLRMVAGLEEISGGELLIDGKRMNDVAPKGRDIAMVFQSYALYPHMTVRENMEFPLKLRKMPKDEMNKRVDEVAQILDITQYLDRKPKALSGGQRQMRAELIKLRQRIDTTFIYVTHDQTEAMTLGDRIVIMKDGIVQQVGTPQEVFDHPANIFVAGFIGMPQMNMFDAKLIEQSVKYSVELGGVSIILSEEKQAALAKNNVKSQEITLGIRPEHIALAEAGKDAITGKVDVSEMMGSAIHLHVNACGRDTIIIVQTMDLTGGEDLSIGSEISFAFGGNAVHVFNKESGENLEFI